MKSPLIINRRYWLWVTRKEYYLDEDGNERGDLEPSEGFTKDAWWTCDQQTRRGDLVLLYRTAPMSDIGYLIQAESDAYWIGDDESAKTNKWNYGCDYHVLSKFKTPITLQDMRSDPFFKEWSAYRRSFQGRSFEIPEQIWQKLTQIAAEKDKNFPVLISELEHNLVANVIVRERELEEWLVDNLDKLRQFGFDLEIYKDADTGKSGVQFVLGIGGRIDLLCTDRKNKRYIVIELKNVKARKDVIAQISVYMGWVQKNIARKIPVVGLVISRGIDQKFEASLNSLGDRIYHLDLKQLGLK